MYRKDPYVCNLNELLKKRKNSDIFVFNAGKMAIILKLNFTFVYEII